MVNYKDYIGLNANGMFYFPSSLPIWSNYSFNRLEPNITPDTMEAHFDRHHKKYISNLNLLLSEQKKIFGEYRNVFDILNICDGLKSEIEQSNIINKLTDDNSDFKLFQRIKFNAGGHLNHTMYWTMLTPDPKDISPIILTLIEQQFGDFDNFLDQFVEESVKIMGSGWTWLLAKKNSDNEIVLQIKTTKNHDVPFLFGEPLIVCDLWEHAYYIDYGNDRDAYVRAFFGVLDWEVVKELLQLYLEE